MDHIQGEPIPNGYYHLVVDVWIRNSKGEFLISQHSASRPTFPLMYECVSGSVLKGESSLEDALREVQEEVGLELEKNDGKLLFSKICDIFKGKPSRSILDVWLFTYDGALHLEDATSDEVTCCRWMNISKIQKLHKEKQLL